MRAVALLSGGLDSVVALSLAREAGEVALALTFDYGQRAAAREKDAAEHIAAHYGIPHQVVALPWLRDLLPQALDARETTSEDGDVMDVRRVWVPNRNGVFLNIAAAFAEAKGADSVLFGANLEEGADFPDNTPAFRDAITQSLAYSTLNRVQVVTPVGHLDKPGIVQAGLRLNAPLHLVWSCYEANTQHCGVCASCLRLRNALAMAAFAGKVLPDVVFSG